MPLPISSLFSFYKKLLLGALDFLLSFFLILIIIGHLDIMELYYFYFFLNDVVNLDLNLWFSMCKKKYLVCFFSLKSSFENLICLHTYVSSPIFYSISYHLLVKNSVKKILIRITYPIQYTVFH